MSTLISPYCTADNPIADNRNDELITSVCKFLAISPMSQPITITVKLFAIYQEVLKTPEISLELPDRSPVATVLDQLIAQYPVLQPWRDLTQFGVNLEQAPPDRCLADGDEVVLIPPVSGG
jgi:sulfur-carrier protein